MGKPDADDVTEAVELFLVVLPHYRNSPPSPAHLGDSVVRCGRCTGPVKGHRHSMSSPNDSHSHGIYYDCTRNATHLHVPVSHIDETLQTITRQRLSDPMLALRLRARLLVELDEQVALVDKALSWHRASTLRRRSLVKKRINERSRALDGTKLLDYWFAVPYSLERHHRQLIRQRDFLNSSPAVDRVLQADWSLSPGSELRRRQTLLHVAAGADLLVIGTSPGHGIEPGIRLAESEAPDTISPQAIDARVAELQQAALALEESAKDAREAIARAKRAATRNAPSASCPSDVFDAVYRPMGNRADRRREQRDRRTDK